MGLRVAISYLRDLPLEAVLEQVRTLPPETIVFFIRQFLGRGGASIDLADAVREIAAVAAAPVYVATDPLIGSGAVGGAVVNMEFEARQLASLALRVARDGAHTPQRAESTLVPMFDWRALRRWGISEARLPAGSIVQFRELSVWERYRNYIVGAIVLVILQSALIGGLMIQRAQRRESDAALRRSFEQNQDLAGRLIHAQEEERSRIARDLHDDVNQQLAGVGIMLSGLKRTLSRSGTPEVDASVAALQERTSTLAHAIRHLSHELHPGVLKHAGLAAALTQHCAEVQQHHRLAVNVISQEIDPLDFHVALCLYRVTQEALTNIVRHAQAPSARVELLRTEFAVELRIVDDGVGFVATERATSGLGLRSIDDRVRLAGGTVGIESRPGAGTSLRVRIPLAEAAPTPQML